MSIWLAQIAEVGMDLCPPRNESKESFATDDLELPEAAVDEGTASVTRDVTDDIRLCFRWRQEKEKGFHYLTQLHCKGYFQGNGFNFGWTQIGEFMYSSSAGYIQIMEEYIQTLLPGVPLEILPVWILDVAVDVWNTALFYISQCS